jgi:hypothetical protein
MTSPPPRLLDDPSTGEQVRSLLDAGKSVDPPPGLQESAWSRLEANLAPPPVPPAAPAAVWIAVGAIVGAGALAVGLAWPAAVRQAPSAPVASATALAAAPRETALPQQPKQTGAETALPPPAPPAPESSSVQLDDLPTVPVPPRGSGSAAIDATAESALVQEARAKLRGGDASGALAVLAEADKKFPGGTLSVERAVLRITALDRTGRKSEAKASAKAFVRSHPDSPYAERLKTIAGDDR